MLIYLGPLCILYAATALSSSFSALGTSSVSEMKRHMLSLEILRTEQ